MLFWALNKLYEINASEEETPMQYGWGHKTAVKLSQHVFS